MQPLFIDWAITNRCNLHCAHCRGLASGEPSTDQALDLVSQIADLGPGWLLVEGGEPLLRPDLFQILEVAKDLGLKIELVTSGQGEAYPQELSKLEVGVSVSLEAVGEEYERLRKGGSFGRLLTNLQALRTAGLLRDLIFTLHAGSAGQVEKVLQLALEFECGVTLLGYKPKSKHDSLLMNREDYGRVLELFGRTSKQMGIEVSADEPFFHLLGNSSHQGPIVPQEKGCIYGRYLFIDADGKVRPCTFSTLELGTSQNLKKVWEDWLESGLLQKILERKHRKGRCGSCRFSEMCGGCRSRATILCGDLLGEDPLCPV